MDGLYRFLLFEITNQWPELIDDLIQSGVLDNSAVALRFRDVQKALAHILDKGRFPDHRLCLFIDLGLAPFQF